MTKESMYSKGVRKPFQNWCLKIEHNPRFATLVVWLEYNLDELNVPKQYHADLPAEIWSHMWEQ